MWTKFVAVLFGERLCDGRAQVRGVGLQTPRTAWMGDLSTEFCLLPHKISAALGAGGAVPVRNVPCLVINQGFPRTVHPTLPPLLTPVCWLECGLDTRAPLPRNGGAGPPSPSEAARLIRAGGSRRRARKEPGGGRRLPVGARTKPQLRLLCPFQTAFVPITAGPAAIWAEAARSARGRGPRRPARSQRGPCRSSFLSLRDPKFALPSFRFSFGENRMGASLKK